METSSPVSPMVKLPLPIELQELIIDFINDERTLQTTSLVCKAWLTRSRFNLFRVVELNIPDHLDRLVDLLGQVPQVAPYIQEICISENSLLALFRPSMSIVARLPDSLSVHPHVKPRRLVVHNQQWLPTRYNPDYLSGLSQLSSIASLELFDVTFTTVADFSIVLRALRNLRSLSATDVDCQRKLHPDMLEAIGTELPLLSSLRVGARSPSHGIDWLIAHNTFPALKTADVAYELSGSYDSPQGLGAFWAATGATLEHLSLDISKRTTDSLMLDHVLRSQLDLSHCTALRTLRLDCRNAHEVAPDWTWFTWLLGHLPRPARALRTIAFAFQHSSHALATLHTFAEELESVLAESPSLASLSAVIFQFDLAFTSERDEDEERLLRKFAALRSKAILHIA
ncbi:hypothetical protein C8Q80DRAFT_778882 [Daedaleopsis nitida]|nr:hypothetical protein C8Q80DRAFT_778882 [Daedaleopsis nitida]